MATYMPGGENEYLVWQNNFSSVAGDNATALGLSAGEISTIETAATNYANALTAIEGAKLAYHAAVNAKNAAASASRETLRQFAMEFKNNPSVSLSLKTSLGLNMTITPLGPVVPPSDLTATAYTNGVNSLKWQRNGNRQTIFIIEALNDGASEWAIVGQCTKTSIEFEGCTVGQGVTYRVRAMRGDVQSAPSNFASVYIEEPPELELAAA